MPGSIGRRNIPVRRSRALRAERRRAARIKPPFEEAVEKETKSRGPTKEQQLKEWVKRAAEIKEIEKRLEEDLRFRKSWIKNFKEWDKKFKEYKKKEARKSWKKKPLWEKINILNFLLNRAVDLLFLRGVTSKKYQQKQMVDANKFVAGYYNKKTGKNVPGELEKQLEALHKEYEEIQKKYEAL